MISSPQQSDDNSRSTQRLPGRPVVFMAGCWLLIFAGISPVLFSFAPEPTARLFAESPVLGVAGKAILSLLLLAIVLLVAKMDVMRMPAKLFLYGGLLLLAFILTNLHWQIVDSAQRPDAPGLKIQWQEEQYTNILAGQESVPHQYRFLPQGVLWWFNLASGDFVFAYKAYRLFFTFAICLSLYKLSRIYNPLWQSVVVVLLYAVFYPLSIRYYYGNLLDPMFHAIFLLGLICCRQRRPLEFFFLVTAGMFVKETIILLVPCYYLLNMETPPIIRGRLISRLVGLTGWCLALFLACRIPFGFSGNNQSVNGVNQLMIALNLWRPVGMSIWIRHLHPILFIFMWIPIVVIYRRFLTRSLYYTTVYVAASIYLTNLCFGWNYESRNFVPALCMLAISTVHILNQMSEYGRIEPDGPTSQGSRL